MLSIPLLLSCATPVPLAADYYHQVPQSDLGLAVDLDFLSTAKLSPEKRLTGEELIKCYHSSEDSLTGHVKAVRMNLDANEEPSRKYSIADAVKGQNHRLLRESRPAIHAASVKLHQRRGDLGPVQVP